MSEQTLEISWQTIVKVLAACFVVYILFLTRNVAVWFLFALTISLLLDPLINFLRWLRFPKILAVVTVYVCIFGALGLVAYLVSPIFLFELAQFSKNIPDYLEKINPILKNVGIETTQNFQDTTSLLMSGLQQSSTGIVRAITTFFGGVYSTFLIFAIAFFISLEDRGTERVLAFLAPKKYKEYVVHLFERAQLKVSGWFGARIISCLFMGAASFTTFYLLGIKYAFTLALISGVLNFIPYIGPTISLVLAVLFVGISSSWIVAGYMLVIILIIQEIENKALTPLLMKKFMDLPPVLVLLSLLIGGTLFGFLGTVFAVPIFGIIFEFSKEFLERRREESPM